MIRISFFQLIVNGVTGKDGQAVGIPVVLRTVPVIKPEQGQVQLRVMVELHVLCLMEVILNLAAQRVQVRQIT